MTFIRYLPHSWDNQRTTRFIAADSRESYPIGEYFKRELGLDDKRDKHDGTARKRPHYVVFAMSKRLFDCVEPLKDIIQSDEDLGVTVLTVFDDVPKECSLLFTLSDSGQHTMTYLREIDRPDAILRWIHTARRMPADACALWQTRTCASFHRRIPCPKP